MLCVATCVGCAGSSQKVARIQVPDLPPPVTKPIENVHVALVLSSGGFRGSAHIGVIEVLEENHIPVDLIVGSSAGSFVGAFYADEPNAAALKQKLMGANYSVLIDTSWVSAMRAPFYPTGPIRGRALQKFMLANLRSRDFNDLKIPLLVATTSIINNNMEVLQTGPIIPAVHASMALPPYFAPVNVYENSYVDGGVMAPVPVALAQKYHPKLIIAVDICKRPSRVEPANAFQITSKAIDLSYSELAERQAKTADIIIRPEIRGYGPFDDEDVLEYYQAGRRAALLHIEEIKAAVLKFQQQSP
ncbi:MAG TPA: patatin-like phospholipase family protein [Gammaproteobacteria bacterium]|nr:patatin-like phospholipase family protein [Gammaproteobacteria bacterium]